MGKILEINKFNVMNWIKKSSRRDVEKRKVVEEKSSITELDELYRFLKRRPGTKACLKNKKCLKLGNLYKLK